MIKTGQYCLSQLKKNKPTFFRKELKNSTITLYDKIDEDCDAEVLAERILLLFSDERGAYKRTYQNRFEAFDVSVIELLKEKRQPEAHLTFHDVAVSDGRTALDFFEKMIRVFPDINYFASDYNPCVFVLTWGKLKVTLSQNDQVLEVTFPPFVFNMMKRDSFRHYPINHLCRKFLEVFLVAPLLSRYRQNKIQAKALQLFSPQVLLKAKKDNRFELGQYSLLQPLSKQSDVIRAMNVLNLSYFSEQEFNKIFHHLYDGLSTNGILIIGSNQEAGSLVNGSIYEKTTHGFKKIFQSGSGAPIDDLILKFQI